MVIPTDTIRAADLPEAPLRAALRLWHGAAARPEGWLPPAEALDISQLDRSLLPHLALTTGIGADGRIFGLYLGSAAAIAIGRDIAGRYLDEVYPPALLDTAQRFFAAVAEAQGPVYETFEIGPDNCRTVSAARLGLPFGGADGKVSRILLALHYRPSPTARQAGIRVMQDRSRMRRQQVLRVAL